jgi:hypothetical protein
MRTRSILVALAATLLLAAPAHAARPADGRFKGETNQGLSILVKTKGGGIDRIRVYVQDTCGATRKPIEVTTDIEVAKDGTFSASFGDGSLKVRGRFKGNDVSGRLRERVQDPQDPLVGVCDTKKVTFTASR